METVPHDEATIVVQMVGFTVPGWFKARVCIDDRVVGVLSDAGARSILVDAGTHRVRAYVGSMRSRELGLSLESGERIALECGFKRPVLPHFGISLAIGTGLVFVLLGQLQVGSVVQGLGVLGALVGTVVDFAVPGRSFYLRRRAVVLDADAEARPIDAPTGPAAMGPGRGFQFDLRGLLITIACFAPVLWVGRELWDRRPANQPARAARLLRSEDSNDRYNGAWNLQTLLMIRSLTPEQLDEAIPSLLAALRDQDPRVREAVAACFFSLVFEATKRGAAVPRVQEVAAGLAEGLVDPLPKVRHHSGLSLANIYFGTTVPSKVVPALPLDTRRFVDLLCQGLEDPERENQQWARQVLESIAPRLKQPAPAQLVELLRAPDTATRVRAFRIVAAFSSGIDAALPDLIAALEHEADPSARVACSGALIGVRPSFDSFPVLRKALSSPEQVVRFRAADLISNLGPRACEAVPEILPLLEETFEPGTIFERKHPEWNDPAVAATWALGALAPGTPMADTARASLTEMLRRPGHPWRHTDGEWALRRLDPATAAEAANASAPSQ